MIPFPVIFNFLDGLPVSTSLDNDGSSISLFSNSAHGMDVCKEVAFCSPGCVEVLVARPFSSSVIAIAAWIIASSAVALGLGLGLTVSCTTHRGLSSSADVELVLALMFCVSARHKRCSIPVDTTCLCDTIGGVVGWSCMSRVALDDSRYWDDSAVYAFLGSWMWRIRVVVSCSGR